MRMFIHHRTCFAGRAIHKVILVALVFAFCLTCVFPAAAQKEKKKKTEPPPSTDSSKTMVSLSDEQQIDYTLSEMLGAWQLGDVEMLHKDYADDVAVVNGSWAPPVLGWTNYLAIYQQQRARMQQVRMDRFNTYIKVSGAVGWACYQWEFAGVLDGQQTESQGQTTVVLEKRNNHWVIVLNHTSRAPRPPQATPASTPPGQAQPAKPTPR
jgi:ketosteroid isomerase-like protein